MQKCLGIDPDQPHWNLAAFQVASGRDIEDLELSSVRPDAMSCGFYQWADERLVRRGELYGFVRGESGQLDFTRALKAKIAEKQLYKFFQKHCEEWGEPDYLGFVHPYFAAPVVRRSLPLLVAGELLPSEGEVDVSKAPRQCDLRKAKTINLSAIDAPSAACLELVASRSISPPVDLLLVTGTPDSAEVAAVQLTLEGCELQIRICGVARVHPEIQLPILPKRLGVSDALEWSEVRAKEGDLREFSQWSTASKSLRKIFYFGSELRSVAESIREKCGDAAVPVCESDKSNLAIGAARYAALCSLNELPAAVAGDLTSTVRALRIDHVFPRSLGIVGTNGQGAWFWRRLFSSNQPLREALAQVVYLGAMPDRVLLAESEDVSPPTWIPQVDWGRWGLRHFATGVPEVSADVPEGAMRICVENPCGRTRYRWSDCRVRITLGKV